MPAPTGGSRPTRGAPDPTGKAPESAECAINHVMTPFGGIFCALGGINKTARRNGWVKAGSNVGSAS